MQANINLRLCGTMHLCLTPYRIAISMHMSGRIHQITIYLCCWYEVWSLFVLWSVEPFCIVKLLHRHHQNKYHRYQWSQYPYSFSYRSSFSSTVRLYSTYHVFDHVWSTCLIWSSSYICHKWFITILNHVLLKNYVLSRVMLKSHA